MNVMHTKYLRTYTAASTIRLSLVTASLEVACVNLITMALLTLAPIQAESESWLTLAACLLTEKKNFS